jgi:hypothetical protein
MSDAEQTIKKIAALQKSLGSATTGRFLSLLHGDVTELIM